jgi:hypothetical protein
MKKTLCITAALATALLAGCSHPQPVYAPPPPIIDFQAVHQQGYQDGFEAARRDVQSGQPPVFNHHPRYRNPPVPPPGFQAYRQGFREGYNRFLHAPPA